MRADMACGDGLIYYINTHERKYYKPTPLFGADAREIAHGLIIRTIRYSVVPRLTGECNVVHSVGACQRSVCQLNVEAARFGSKGTYNLRHSRAAETRAPQS